ncbi:hypothetical protein BXZ70DRAFT_989710 [Cristinia sonorae]|uniref:UDENN domain-containing protein n=1 Tax=Cristinia sonorae TaxID=1940300 RepID=A0A8K0XP83_9AGAR|nr:hypothetical protein BXZ70DRAFT_989710 [Cristinia sonorae]
MEHEVDIGLSSITRRSGSSASSPPRLKRYGRPSTIIVEDSIGLGHPSASLRSPSSPNLLKEFPPSATSPLTPRKLSRSNTLPRLQINHDDGLESLSMESSKVWRLRRWIHALVLVNFDLEYGPKITKTFPHLTLTPSEAENIAFSSFPDAPQIELGSQMHSFRVRPHDPDNDKLVRVDRDRPVVLDGYMYGYSYFTQRRDTTSKRGYQQSSLVILSPHPYPALFYTLLSYLGQSFLTHGGPMLEVACHNIASWSDPNPGVTLELGFLGFVFNAELPSSADTPQTGTVLSITEYDQDVKIMASIPPPHPPIINVFGACLQHMWSIWECLVLCEPILVYGTSAALTSQAVWWMRDILRPIPITGDFRPFFTIHDTDYKEFVNSRPPQPGVVLGVTNPIIERTCKHWPHSISLGAVPKKERYPATPKTPKTPWTPAESTMSAGPAPGWKSKTHKRYISRDRALQKKIEDACKGNDRARIEASHALRLHFSARTTAFLAPLQRYLNTLIPTPSEAGIATSAPTSTPSVRTSPLSRLKPFNTSAFLASLSSSQAVSTLPFKSSSKQREFYERWLRTRAFGVWLGMQEEVVSRVLRERGCTV